MRKPSGHGLRSGFVLSEERRKEPWEVAMKSFGMFRCRRRKEGENRTSSMVVCGCRSPDKSWIWIDLQILKALSVGDQYQISIIFALQAETKAVVTN